MGEVIDVPLRVIRRDSQGGLVHQLSRGRHGSGKDTRGPIGVGSALL
jgi:hypothetical protein